MNHHSLTSCAALPPVQTSFVEAALVPLVKALAGEPGLGAWEIMNEPEGSVSLTAGVGGVEPCFDPSKAERVGWAGNDIPLRYLQVGKRSFPASISQL
jgi:mannan endo-1,4-beta-mannosidase